MLALVISVPCLTVACARCGPADDVSEAERGVVEAYPKGTWRFRPYELRSVRLSFAQIVVSHGDMARNAQRRSLEEASKRATSAYAELARNPGAFADVARRYSDDERTREQGGFQGVVAATELAAPVLDALDTLSVTETSHPFHVPQGIAIVQRVEPPPQERFAVSEIVVGYGSHAPVGARVERSRDEAAKLGNQIMERLRSGESFAALAQKYSDAESGVKGGDIGVWSNYESAGFAPELGVLSKLANGKTSAVIDSPRGLQILRRLAAEPRKAVLAASRIVVGWNGEPLQTVRAREAEVLAQVEAEPSRYFALQRRYCCEEHQRHFDAGRLPPSLEEQLSKLEVGRILNRAVWFEGSWQIFRREPEDGDFKTPEYSFAIPRPDRVDLEWYAQRMQGKAVASLTTSVAQAVLANVVMADHEGSRLREIFSALAEDMQTIDPELRPARVQQAVIASASAVGPSRASEVFQAFRERMTSRVLEGDPLRAGLL
jgi:hypothetical protein